LFIGERIRDLRRIRGMSQEEVARRAGVSLNLVNKLERGVITDPHYSTLVGLAKAFSVRLEQLIEEEEVESAVPLGDASDPEPGRRREERRSSRFAAAIAAAADRWGEAMASSDMGDAKRFGLMDAALDLSDLISESVEEEDWDVIPNEERLEIVTTMEKLGEATERGLRHLQETAEARTQAEQVNQSREQIREQIREWTRRISA
jgi:transcriptional regulator with XRE-family HTH domain